MESKTMDHRRVDQLSTPAFLVDRKKIEANCSKIREACAQLGVSLRAQTKTHKTIEGALLQTGGSSRGLVTSTLQEAEFYADHSFDDILFGFPLIPSHIPRVFQLTRRLKEFHVMLDSQTAVDSLTSTVPPPGKSWSVFLAINCGNNREGVWWESEQIHKLVLQLHECGSICFKGIYVHCGNSYNSTQAGYIESVRDNTIERMVNVSDRIKSLGVPCEVIGIGSTPTCSKPGDNMKKLTELHPGNYIFYDMQQVVLGSCSEEDVACCVATRVIGHYRDRNQLLIDCGFTGLTKQGTGMLPTGCCRFRHQPNLKLTSMTQEIGFVEAVEGQLDFDRFPIDSLLFILPWHSCATAAMYPVYYVVEEDRVLGEWRPTRGW